MMQTRSKIESKEIFRRLKTLLIGHHIAAMPRVLFKGAKKKRED